MRNPETPESARVDVVVIGAGLAGLTAAREVKRLGRSVAIFEAMNRVGGRTLSHDLDGTLIDLGGTFVGPTQERILALARELGCDTYPTFETGEHILQWRGRLHRFTGTIPKVSAATLLNLAYIRFRLDRLSRSIPLGRPWTARNARKLDAQTLGSWMRKAGAAQGTIDLMEIAVQISWGCEIDEISLLHVLHYLHSAGGLDIMLDTGGGAQESHFISGAHRICELLAEGLTGDLALNAPVTRIEWQDDRVTVHAGDARVQAKRVIVAVSPAMRAKIQFEPGLPAPWNGVAQRWPQGQVSKAYAVYDRPFWRGNGLNGQALSDAGPVCGTFDASPHDSSKGVLLGFIAADKAREWDALDDAERRLRALSCFAALFGDAALQPLGYIDHRWVTDAWIGNGPVAAAPPLAWTNYGRGLATPIGPIHWAGTETADRWTGFMDGAVRSGERAAREILTSTAREKALPSSAFQQDAENRGQP